MSILIDMTSLRECQPMVFKLKSELAANQGKGGSGTKPFES